MPIDNLCQCMRITYTVTGGVSTTVQVNQGGTYNGYYFWEFSDGGVTYTIWHDASNNWNVTTDGVGGFGFITSIKVTTDPCPFASLPVWTPNTEFTEFTTEACIGSDCCIQIHTEINGENIVFEINIPTGIYNTTNYWKFNVPPSTADFYLIREQIGLDCQWQLYQDFTAGGVGSGTLIYVTDFIEDECVDCPRGIFTNVELKAVLGKFEIYDCGACLPLEDRIFKPYNAI